MKLALRPTITLLVLVLVIAGSLLGCGTSTTPKPVIQPPTRATVIPSSTPVPVTEDCKYEEKMNGSAYQYRSSTGCGIFVIFSVTHYGDHDELVVRVKRASSEWTTKPVWENWIALFATEEDARTAVCNAVINECRIIDPGSEWILGGVPCQ